MKRYYSIILLLLVVVFNPRIFAQEVDIVPYLKMIEQGKAIEVKGKLLDLKSEYPKSANLVFLEGVLTENGQEAVVIYQNLVDKYPKCAYADAALYRLYSYYFALGLYNTADKNLAKLKTNYPESPYIKMIAPPDVAVNEVEEKTEPVETKKENLNTSTGDFSFTIQAGAFTNTSNANTLKKEIEKAGVTSFIKEKNVAGTVFNIVYIGKYKTRKEAEDFLPIANNRFKLTGRVVEINQ